MKQALHVLAAVGLAVTIAAAPVATVQAQSLAIGLQDDPDQLDPHRSRTFAARVVLTALCDKLVDAAPDLAIVPRLATSWSWSADGLRLSMTLRRDARFHDGALLDAEAVKASLNRAKTLPDSLRKGDLASLERVEVDGPNAVTLVLSAPDASLLAQLADRAGMIVSPRADVPPGTPPACSGPFRFVERVAQDRIILDRFDGHWERSAYGIQRLSYHPIPNPTVRLANLRAGQLQLIERVAPSDVATVRGDRRLALATAPGIGFQGLAVNVANGPAADTPLGRDRRVREALSLAIDREALVRVVFEGLHAPGIQPLPPTSPWARADIAPPARDLARARALLREAGHERVPVELMATANPIDQQVAEVIQAMAREAGFEISIRQAELGALLRETAAGRFQLATNGWGGRIDPDGNMFGFLTCRGGFNEPKYCDETMDRLLTAARAETDPSRRKALYGEAIAKAVTDLPWIVLYHPVWLYAVAADVQGFRAHPDGLIRLDGVTRGR
jgi:peptide/nickel transport system substrate-binding protein